MSLEQKLNPITTEIIRNAFLSAAEEMVVSFSAAHIHRFHRDERLCSSFI